VTLIYFEGKGKPSLAKWHLSRREYRQNSRGGGGKIAGNGIAGHSPLWEDWTKNGRKWSTMKPKR
jgi:hypothetical protein